MKRGNLNLCKIISQRTLVKGQCRNRWSLFSMPTEQRQQTVETCKPQAESLSIVDIH
ncbi:unnamed protein product [Arabidopsis halleri]